MNAPASPSREGAPSTPASAQTPANARRPVTPLPNRRHASDRRVVRSRRTGGESASASANAPRNEAVHSSPPAAGDVVPLNYNERMRGLRWVYLVALAVWLGGLVVLGACVAPGLFGWLAPDGAAQGRQAAAGAFAAVLDRFHVVSYGAGVTLLGSLMLMALVGPRPRPWAPRVAIVLAMLAATFVVHVPAGRAMARLQLDSGRLPSQLEADDPRRTEFEWLHRLSTALLLVNVGGGLVLFAWETRT